MILILNNIFNIQSNSHNVYVLLALQAVVWNVMVLQTQPEAYLAHCYHPKVLRTETHKAVPLGWNPVPILKLLC